MKPIFVAEHRADTRSQSFRPQALLAYEHMFPSLRTSTLAQRTLGALDLARSFLMLEDDHGVDWEVDRNEPFTPVHPHRAPLRRRFRARRPGERPPALQDCISPTFYGQPDSRRNAGATRESEFSARRGRRAARTETRAARPCPSPAQRHDGLA
jgi:hypothetical protein